MSHWTNIYWYVLKGNEWTEKDLYKEFIKHLLAHGGSYTDLWETTTGIIYGGTNIRTSSSTPITPFQMTPVCNSK